MPPTIDFAFIAPTAVPHSRRPRVALCHSKNCLTTTIATASPNSQSSTQSNSASLLSRQPIRKALFALIAATTTFLPTRVAPASAAHQYSNNTTVARAVPKSSTLNNKSSNPKKSTAASYDPHAASTPFAIAGTSALLASAVAVAITHPIDTIKTTRQARASGATTAPLKFGNLYRGVASNILKEAPNAAIYLATYEVFKTALLKIHLFAAVPLLAMCFAGMLGDAVGSVVRVPAEIVNKRLQLGLSDGWRDAVTAAFLSENGVQSTFAAWLAVLWRDVPYGGLQIAGYEFVRLVLAGWGMSGVGYSVVAGAIAGLVAAVVTTPADVLVTRMSTQSPQCYLETRQYMSPSATFRRILRDEGFGALWTGAAARGLFYMPMIGLFFAIYEMFKYAFMNPYASGAVAMSICGMVIGRMGSGYGMIMRIFRAPLQVALLMLGSRITRRRRPGRDEPSVNH